MPSVRLYETNYGTTTIRLGKGYESARWGEPVHVVINLPEEVDATIAMGGLCTLMAASNETGGHRVSDDFPVFAADVLQVAMPYPDTPHLITGEITTKHINAPNTSLEAERHTDEAFQICEALTDFVLSQIAAADSQPPEQP